MTSDPTVEREVELDAPADVVWAALTEDDSMSAWFGGRVTLDAVPGGEGRFDLDDGAARRGRVDEVEPGRRLSWRWWEEGDDDGPITTVTFELTELGARTRLVVTERPLLTGAQRASADVIGRGLGRLQMRAGVLARA
jgi:uncharacterized protein YndB with AHSA1/START domain